MIEKVRAAPVARRPDAAFAATVSFRSAVAGDVPALVTMINDSYLREAHIFPEPRTYDAEIERQIAAPHSRIIVAEVARALAGCVRVRLPDEGAWFGLLATHRMYQGRGLASMLIGEAERVARGAGSATLRLDCAAELGLPPFYASLGYAMESVEPDAYFTNPGPPVRRKGPITRVVMRKDL